MPDRLQLLHAASSLVLFVTEAAATSLGQLQKHAEGREYVFAMLQT
jgi:hypothetical protein